MNKILLFVSLWGFFTVAHAMQQPPIVKLVQGDTEMEILDNYYKAIEPNLVTQMNAFNKRFKPTTSGAIIILPKLRFETGRENFALQKAREEIEKKSATYLKELKELYPKQYAHVTTLNVPWRHYPSTKSRYKHLLALLQVWRDPKSEPWKRLPLGFETGDLSKKTDQELEAIAQFYAPTKSKLF